MNSYHEQLQIVSGVPLTPGDTTTQERGLQVIDLLSTGTGWSVDPEWYPARPALKNGGIWQNSNAADGATLLDAYDGNVIENIQVDLSASSAIELHTRLSIMEKMIRDARLFWSTDWQIEPVYLRWWAKGAKGPQFALIYNIEMDVARNGTVEDYTRSVSLQITREPYWRWEVEPGASPQKWSVFKNGGTWSSTTGNLSASNLGASYDFGVLNSNALANYHRTTEVADAVQSETCQGNFIVIPADEIPGDAPALTMIDAISAGGTWLYASGSAEGMLQKFWIGRKTNPTYDNLSGVQVIQRGTWPVDAQDTAKFRVQYGPDTALAANTGTYSYSATCDVHTGQLATCTFATTITNSARVAWYTTMNAHRGRYMVFLRGFQTGGAAGNVSMYLEYGTSSIESRTPTVNPPVRALVPPPSWQSVVDIIYMGEVSIPPVSRSLPSRNQFGLQGDNETLTVSLYASATSTTPDLNVFDLVFIPIDECSAIIDFESYVDSQTTLYALDDHIVLDNTGYLAHGRPDLIGCEISVTSNAFEKLPQVVGSGIVVEPGIENRLYFLWSDYKYGVTPEKNTCFIVPNRDPTNTGAGPDWQDTGVLVSVYIVPRSVGARDD